MDQMPDQIRIGMKVLDSEHEVIGTIDDLKFPESATARGAQPATAGDLEDERGRNGSLMDVIAETFGRDQVPEALRERLLREGYVHIDADGLFARDRYILPEQIAGVDGRGVMLNVTRDALIRDPN